MITTRRTALRGCAIMEQSLAQPKGLRKMKFPPRLLLGLVIAALLLSACAVTARNALIGKWDNTTQGVTLEFTMDGHMRQTGQGVTQELGYQFLDDNTITLLAPASAGQAQKIAFHVAGDKLTLDLGADQTTGQTQLVDFQRVK